MEGREKWWVAVHREQFAASFLEALSPISGLFGGSYLPGGIVFRGVDSQEHTLLPSAFRTGMGLRVEARRYKAPLPTVGSQIEAELGTLVTFMNAADRQGYRIPEDSQALRRSLEDLAQSASTSSKRTINQWPPTFLLSVLGLAQHYTVPTRMLDWSWDPYIAAYFAAKSAAGRDDKSGELSVWALLTGFVTIETMFSEGGFQHNKLPVQLVGAPGAENANLRAQRGVFLVYRQFDVDPRSPFKPEPYDELLAKNLVFYQGMKNPILFNCVLPQSEAPELLRLLALQGVDGSSAFPGLEGAARSVTERNLWREPDSRHRDPRSPRFAATFNQIYNTCEGTKE